jgi:hypothetical protein
MSRNRSLKHALRAKFDKQADAAMKMKIDCSKLSSIIGGYRQPTDRELREFKKVLGERNFRRAFPNAHSVARHQSGRAQGIKRY